MFKHTYNQYELLYFRTHNLYEKNEFMNGKIETSIPHAQKMKLQVFGSFTQAIQK